MYSLFGKLYLAVRLQLNWAAYNLFAQPRKGTCLASALIFPNLPFSIKPFSLPQQKKASPPSTLPFRPSNLQLQPSVFSRLPSRSRSGHLEQDILTGVLGHVPATGVLAPPSSFCRSRSRKRITTPGVSNCFKICRCVIREDGLCPNRRYEERYLVTIITIIDGDADLNSA